MTVYDKRRLIGNALLCALAFVLILVNWLWGGVRFTSPRLNVLTFAVSFFLPTISLLLFRRGLGLTTRTPQRQNQAPVSLAVAGSIMVCLLIMLVGTWTLITNSDNIRLVATCPTNGPVVRAYTTHEDNCLANFTSIVVQQERPLFSDLVWVKRLYKEERAYAVKMVSVGPNTVRCAFLGGAQTTVTLKTAR